VTWKMCLQSKRDNSKTVVTKLISPNSTLVKWLHLTILLQMYLEINYLFIWQQKTISCNFIGKLDIFSLMCAADKVWIIELTLIHKNTRSVHNLHVQVYRSIWRKTHYDVTDKNNNVSSEGLDRYYHKYPSSSYLIRWYISDNVCLDLQNCSYSIQSWGTNKLVLLTWWRMYGLS